MCLHVCAKDSEVADNFTQFMHLTEQRAEFAIFINSVMNVGFNPAALVSYITLHRNYLKSPMVKKLLNDCPM